MNFKDKVILITGASRGLGKEIAIHFAKEGASLILNYNKSSEKANHLKEELESKYNVEVMLYQADVKNELEVKEMVEAIIMKFEHIDCLVNNAAIAIDTVYEDKTKENFMETLETNLIGPFLTSKYVAPIMKEYHQGTIINIASTNGIDTEYVESLDYDASKAGLISLTKNLAKAYAPEIRVNAVAPGWINTDMNASLTDEFKQEECAKILLNRFAEPSEIAEVVLFLASDKASYINGSIIRVDGGTR